MEKKKLLLVAVSVGIFLVVAIGASMLLFSPKRPPSGAVVMSGNSPASKTNRNALELLPASGPATVDPSDMVRNATDLQTLQSPPPGSVSAPVVFQNTAAPAPVVINAPKPKVSEPARAPAASSSSSKPAASRPASTETKPQSSGQSAARKAPAASAPPKKSEPAPVKNTKTPPAPAKPAAPAARANSNGYSAYWVQTGSFSTLTRADGVKETLASKGITSVVENRTLDGKTYYRVRVGPYTSQNEADYWLALIKSIDGFEGSQVWRSPTQVSRN